MIRSLVRTLLLALDRWKEASQRRWFRRAVEAAERRERAARQVTDREDGTTRRPFVAGETSYWCLRCGASGAWDKRAEHACGTRINSGGGEA